MRKLLFALFLLGTISLPSIATPVQFVNLRDDLVTSLKVGLNRPTHIKAPKGFKFYKGWLDNNLVADVDSDRPFQSGASMVYLVGRNRGSATLTLVGKDSTGEETLIVFKISTGTRSGPDIVALQRQGGAYPVALVKSTPVSVLHSGLDSAVSSGRLVPGSKLYRAIAKFTRLIEDGKTAQQAADIVGLDLAVVTEILKMGKGVTDIVRPLPIPTTPLVHAASQVLPPPPSETAAKESVIAKSTSKKKPYEINPSVSRQKKVAKVTRQKSIRATQPSDPVKLSPESIQLPEKPKSPSQRALEDIQKATNFNPDWAKPKDITLDQDQKKH